MVCRIIPLSSELEVFVQLFLTASTVFILFLPFVYLASRTLDEERRMRARFGMLQRGGAGALAPGRKLELKNLEVQSPGWQIFIVARVSAWLHLNDLLLQANSQQTPWQLLRLCGLAAIGTVLASLLVTRHAVSLLFGAGAACCPWVLLKLRAKRRLTAMDKALPQVLDMISRALRAGHSLAAALGIVAEAAAEPARSAFSEVYQKQKFGLPLRDALLELVRRFPSSDLKVLATAVLVQRDTGGNLVQILERTSTVVRERLKLQGDIRVHTAQGRLTGWILCLLPVLMMAMLLLTNPSYPKVLLDDPFGRKLLYGGVLLLGVGGYLIQRIVKTIEV